MELKDWIYRRKSTRSYTNVPVEEEVLQKLQTFLSDAKPLIPDLRIHWDIVPRSQVRCLCPWTTPQVLTIYTEEKDFALENVGFLFQQADLYLNTLGLGTCWLGMGRMTGQGAAEQTADGLKFAIMLAFGHPKGPHLRKSRSEFRRKPSAEIADRPDERLEPARFAPSSVNSQPWYFTHEGEFLHVYCAQKGGLFKSTALSDMNRIDIGIALAHLYVANPETFRFFQTDSAPAVKDHRYLGSITL